MKITLIHGNNTRASYTRFQFIVESIKKRNWEINFIEKGSLSLSERLSGGSLFTQERLFIISNISDVTSKEWVWLSKNSESLEGNLLIYKDGELTKKQIESLGKNVKIEKFDLPKIIFNFLDSLKIGNSKESLKLFHETIKTDPVELVFALVCTHFRDLYWASKDPKTLKLPSWRSQKLIRQAKFFRENQIEVILSKLSEFDISAKTSRGDLTQSLDLLILKELK